MEAPQAKGARDRRRVDPHPVFAKRILEPIFEFNCRHNFLPLIEAHRAWVAMLAEREIVPRASAAAILRGLNEIEQAGPESMRPFDAGIEFFYLHMERALVQRVAGGEAVVGNLNLGRTRPPSARGRFTAKGSEDRNQQLGHFYILTAPPRTILVRG